VDAVPVPVARNSCTGRSEYETRFALPAAVGSRSDTASRSWSLPVRRRSVGSSRQFRFQALVNLLRNQAPTTATIPGSRFPPRLSRMGFGPAPRERRRLSLPGALPLFQSPLQLLHPALQALNDGLQLHYFLPQSSILLNQRLHAPTYSHSSHWRKYLSLGGIKTLNKYSRTLPCA